MQCRQWTGEVVIAVFCRCGLGRIEQHTLTACRQVTGIEQRCAGDQQTRDHLRMFAGEGGRHIRAQAMPDQRRFCQP